jgi:hypothetical protein
MQTKTNVLISRLSSYFLIVSAGIFIAVQGFAIVKHVQLQTRLTTPDYINVAKLVIALSAIVITIRALGRDKSSQVTRSAVARVELVGRYARSDQSNLNSSSCGHSRFDPVISDNSSWSLCAWKTSWMERLWYS